MFLFFFDVVPLLFFLTCESFVFLPFLKPSPVPYLLLPCSPKENLTSLLSFHFDAIGCGDIIFLCLTFSISKILGVKRFGRLIDDWEISAKQLVGLFQPAKLRTHSLTFTNYSKLLIRFLYIIPNLKAQ